MKFKLRGTGCRFRCGACAGYRRTASRRLWLGSNGVLANCILESDVRVVFRTAGFHYPKVVLVNRDRGLVAAVTRCTETIHDYDASCGFLLVRAIQPNTLEL